MDLLGAIAVVALLGADSDLRPSFGGKPLSMVLVIQMFMLLTGALIIILTKTNPASISKNEVFRSGMIAIVAVYGIAWMAETMFGAHMSEIQGVLGEMVKEYPWAYAIVLLLVSKFVNSQAAALAAIVPVALAIGVDPAYIVASAPACYGYYILPTYPSDLAAIQFDRSGTTHIGRFVINHSFILPGLIGVGVAVRLRLDLRRDVRVLINALCVPPVTTRARHFRITNTELQAGSYVKQTLSSAPGTFPDGERQYRILPAHLRLR